MSAPADVKQKVAGAVDLLAGDLEALSHKIHDNPELCFKEEKAHGWLTEFLEKHGAKVERGVGGLPTAFRATIEGSGAASPRDGLLTLPRIRVDGSDGVSGLAAKLGAYR